MKTFFAFLLLLIAAVQARDWYDVNQVLPSVDHEKRTAVPLNNGRIIGGTFATPGQFPHQVALFVDLYAFCGGSLISDTVVLTAAHCVSSGIRVEVHAGVHHIYNETDPGYVVVSSQNVIVHEGYDELGLANNLALVILDQPISGPNIGAVRLPSRSQVGETFTDFPAQTTGWGYTSDFNSWLSEQLRYVDVTIISNSKCEDAYGPIVTSCNLCISTSGGTVGVCNGDHGGPLTITEDDGIATQVGITSFLSTLGCESGFPQGFCRLTCHLDWIEEKSGVVIRP